MNRYAGNLRCIDIPKAERSIPTMVSYKVLYQLNPMALLSILKEVTF